jgi:hypothetical protein
VEKAIAKLDPPVFKRFTQLMLILVSSIYTHRAGHLTARMSKWWLLHHALNYVQNANTPVLQNSVNKLSAQPSFSAPDQRTRISILDSIRARNILFFRQDGSRGCDHIPCVRLYSYILLASKNHFRFDLSA